MNDFIKNIIIDSLKNEYITINIDNNKFENLIESYAIKALYEIQCVIQKDEDDFNIVEKIILIMEKYNLDCGTCHDFG